MTRHSLRLRLALAGAASIGLALVVAFLGLSYLFERHVERRVVAELRLQLDQIAAGLGRDDQGQLDVLRPPLDPRFQRPLSGLYWVVDGAGTRRQSRSLWDETLTLPWLSSSEPKSSLIPGPGGAELLMLARKILPDPSLSATRVLIAAAIDREEVTRATADFRRDLAPFLAILAVLLLNASIIQIIVGLKPLQLLQARIAEIRGGAQSRLGNGFPDEVIPLTAEVDALLQSREEQLQRARRRAADLAHGFKTPLQALAGDVMRLRAAGQTQAADGIETVLISMRRLVDQEMMRARMAGRDHASTADLANVLVRILAVLQRTPFGEAINWQNTVSSNLEVRIDADDLAELLGPILENAARYAEQVVFVTAGQQDTWVHLTIRDDGPGIPNTDLARVLGRGERLDLSSAGAGLGLSIAQNIIEAAGGTIQLGNAQPGLEVSIVLPAAGPAVRRQPFLGLISGHAFRQSF